MSVPPQVVRTAVAIRVDGGEKKVAEFYDRLNAYEKRSIDIWLIRSGHQLVATPCPQKVRFTKLIEEYFANGYPGNRENH
jgi:hypothetical protein